MKGVFLHVKRRTCHCTLSVKQAIELCDEVLTTRKLLTYREPGKKYNLYFTYRILDSSWKLSCFIPRARYHFETIRYYIGTCIPGSRQELETVRYYTNDQDPVV